MPTDPHTPGRDDETVPPVDGEASPVPAAPSDAPEKKEEKKKKQITKGVGPTRRTLLGLLALGAGAAVVSQLPLGKDEKEDVNNAADVVGGTPPEGAEEFRRHLQALQGLLGGQDASWEYLLPELRAEIQTYAELSIRIDRLERTMAARLREQPQIRDAIRTMESSNDVILRLMVERLETQRRREIAGISRPGDAAELRRIQSRNANLVAILKTENNSLLSLVRHVETLAALSHAIDNVPQIPGENRDTENAFLRETYGRINNQVQERMAAPLRQVWAQMPELANMNHLRSFITSAHLATRDPDLVNRRDEIIPMLLTELDRLSRVQLPHPDGIRPDNGKDDRMTTDLQTEARTALVAFQRNPTKPNKDACTRALDRLRHAVIRQTDKITNGREAWLEVRKISLTGLALGGETDDYRAIVHLTQPPAGTEAAHGRLADLTAIAARIERRRAMHQELRNLLGKRSQEGFEQKFQALQSAYRQEMNLEISDMLRRVARNAQSAENAMLGDTTMNYAGREAETRNPDPALASTPERRRDIAASQRGYSYMIEQRLLEHPEERAVLEPLVEAWRKEGLNVPNSKSFQAVVAQLRRMNIPVPPNPERNSYFVHWLNRLFVHAGVAEVYVPEMSAGHLRALAMQQREYADSMRRHARQWQNITDANKPTDQEALEETLEMMFVGYNTRTLLEQAQRQQRELPWLLKFTYDTPIVNWMHKMAPTQIMYELTGGKLGWDLRDIYKNGGSYWWLWNTQPPEYTVAALLNAETEAQMNELGVTRQQFEAMNEDQRKAILERVKERKSETVLTVKRRYGPRITATSTGIIQATDAIEAAVASGEIRNPETLMTEVQYMTRGLPDEKDPTAARLRTIVQEWNTRSGTVNSSMAPSLVRNKLGNDPFKRLQLACERANVNLMEYKTVLRKPAGNWWGEGNTPDADKIRQVFNRAEEPRLRDEEWLWLYFHMLPNVRNMNGSQQQILQLMQRASAEVEREERTLAGMTRATEVQRQEQVQRVFRASGVLMMMYAQLSTQMQLQSDAMAVHQKDYMIDLGRSLGLHFNVAAVQYRLVDQNTSPLAMLGMRVVEDIVTILAAYETLKTLIIRLPRYAWRKWRESVKFKRLATNLEKKLDAKYGTKLEELREAAVSAMEAREEQEKKMQEVATAFVQQLEDVTRRIAECDDIITRGTAEDTAAAPATEGGDAPLPAAEEVPAGTATPEEPKKPKPTPGEVAIARTELAGLTLQQAWLQKMLADMLPDEVTDEEDDEKTPPTAPEATA